MTQSGDSLTSETTRGSVTLYSFAPLDCGSRCAALDQTLQEVAARIDAEVDFGEIDFRIVTIALADDPSPAELTAAATSAGADGAAWQWVGGEWDRVRTVVGAGFRRYFERDDAGVIDFDAGFALVDGNGVIRAEHHYQSDSSAADELIRQADLLAAESRQGGITSLAYDAAHLFLCYG